MDAASANSNSIDPSFILSHQQEELLYAALNSNNPQTKKVPVNHSPQSQNRASMAPSAFTESPLDGAGSLPLNGFEESPFIDYDYEFDPESGFDYDFTNDSQQMIGKLPGTSSDGDAEGPDKRAHPEDEEDNEEGRGKRREGDEKQSKKPGRKPLTAEPTSVSSHS
jgi:AP-1-like factor